MWHFVGYLGTGDVEQYYHAITGELHTLFGIRDLSQKVPPHLTLKYPFEATDTSALERRIEGLVQDQIPIRFSLDGFDRFADNDKTIFLSVRSSEELATFTQDCITELNQLHEEAQFDPQTHRLHLSIARHLDTDMSERIWAYVKQLPSPKFDLLFDNLTLFVFGNGRWEVKKTFMLR